MKIELNVFSGRRNPKVEIGGRLLAEFKERAADFSPTVLKKPDGLILPLGYGGFTATTTDGSREVMHIHSSRLPCARSVEFERWLLDVVNAGPVLFRRSLVDVVVKGIAEGSSKKFATREADHRLPMPHVIAPDHPVYQPTEWNTPEIQPNNNCYAYACNDPTNTFPQPGLGSGKMYAAINAEEVSAAAIRDGLRPLRDWNDMPAQGWRAVLVIWPDNDYHWYRADYESPADALCSHKPGGTEVHNWDDSNKKIPDPTAASCDHGPYTITAGVFNIPGRSAITIA